ncbi:hypothetical protein GQ457_14G024250 [Hibiscus cannabinus]
MVRLVLGFVGWARMHCMMALHGMMTCVIASVGKARRQGGSNITFVQGGTETFREGFETFSMKVSKPCPKVTIPLMKILILPESFVLLISIFYKLVPKCGCVQLVELEYNFAWDLGYRHVILESDSLEALGIVRDDDNRGCSYGIVLHIRELRARNWSLMFQHVRREGNKVADHMAKLVRKDVLATHYYRFPPPSVSVLLDGEAGG